MVDSRPNVWQLQAQHNKPGLIEALRHSDPDVRGRAAAALRTLDAVEAVPALKNALHTETDEQVRRNLVLALHVLDHRTDVSRIAKSQDVNRLVEVLKSRNPDSVIMAAQALGALGNRLAVEPLVILFHSPSSSPAVRLAAAEALLELKSAPAVVTLLGALRRDSWEVRRNAAAVLGQIQAIWAVEPLAAALDDPHPVVRRTAAAALKRIGTAEAIAALRIRFAPPAPPETKPPETKPPTVSKPTVPIDTDAKEAVSDPVKAHEKPPAAESGVTSGHDTRPAEARSVTANVDTRPVTVIPPARPEPAPPLPPSPMTEMPTEPQPPTPLKMTPPPISPVKKLIAFLKRRNGEDQMPS